MIEKENTKDLTEILKLYLKIIPINKASKHKENRIVYFEVIVPENVVGKKIAPRAKVANKTLFFCANIDYSFL